MIKDLFYGIKMGTLLIFFYEFCHFWYS